VAIGCVTDLYSAFPGLCSWSPCGRRKLGSERRTITLEQLQQMAYRTTDFGKRRQHPSGGRQEETVGILPEPNVGTGRTDPRRFVSEESKVFSLQQDMCWVESWADRRFYQDSNRRKSEPRSKTARSHNVRMSYPKPCPKDAECGRPRQTCRRTAVRLHQLAMSVSGPPDVLESEVKPAGSIRSPWPNRTAAG